MKLKNRKIGILIGMILGIVILLSTVSVASASSVTSDGNWEYRIIKSNVYISKYRGVDRNVIIPEQIENLPVTFIESSAFSQTDVLSVIGNSITSLQGGAFYNCTDLKSIDFPSLNTIIVTPGSGCYWGPFYGCSSLEEIIFPELTTVGKGAFTGMDAVKNIELPKLEEVLVATFTNDSSYYNVNQNPDMFNLPKIESIKLSCTLYNQILAGGGMSKYASGSAFKPIHTYDDEWTTTANPTCTSPGEKERTCTICKAEESKEKVSIPVDSTVHKFTTYNYNNDAQVGIDGTESAFCDYGCGTEDKRTKAGTALSNTPSGNSGNSGNSGSSSSSGGGFIFPTTVVQKPTIGLDGSPSTTATASDGSTVIKNQEGTITLSKDGTTVKITPADGYEIDSITINGTKTSPINTLNKLKASDNVIVLFKLKESTDGTTAIANIQEKLADIHIIARSSKTAKNNIKITITAAKESENIIENIQSLGYTVKYKFYRSIKKTSGYSGKVTKTAKSYINTSGKKGRMYYYKARLQLFDSEGNFVSQTELKQCKYANRNWFK